jgi:hypothetical protein
LLLSAGSDSSASSEIASMRVRRRSSILNVFSISVEDCFAIASIRLG